MNCTKRIPTLFVGLGLVASLAGAAGAWPTDAGGVSLLSGPTVQSPVPPGPASAGGPLHGRNNAHFEPRQPNGGTPGVQQPTGQPGMQGPSNSGQQGPERPGTDDPAVDPNKDPSQSSQ